ncbi:hypothetical protein [Nocardioides panzhihuensis]|uniref:Uncharacterized protein n=1 Tax=Nocardioides panzhihuensis TaxID=860243 RepID=A0A7Z0DT01_9ACTN|nr:hypothetical protein [Nocardioides panzhihuensis]NYI81236.1 hypothetical protein [Nocardioides panzhihuensis]
MTVLLFALTAIGVGGLLLIESTPNQRSYDWGWLILIIGIGGFGLWFLDGLVGVSLTI